MAKSVTERAYFLSQLVEVFRAHGYEGATLALISQATVSGRGASTTFFRRQGADGDGSSLAIDRWFVDHIYKPLRATSDPSKGIAEMFAAVDNYFRSGERVCLVGAVALGASRDIFGEKVKIYFRGLGRCAGDGTASARR